MKYCIYCGQELNDDATFCTRCGKNVTAQKVNKTNKSSNDGFGFGLASLLLCWFPILSLVFGILGIVYGTKSKKSSGIILSIIGLCLMVAIYVAAFVIFWIYFYPYLLSEIQKAADHASQTQLAFNLFLNL
jgi:uncharacterized membrane protein YvbJ